MDSRSFLEYNDRHITGAVNVCCSKLVKRRLQQDKVCVRDLLLHSCDLERGLDRVGGAVDESGDVIVYDQLSLNPTAVSTDSFLYVLLSKLVNVFRRVFLLSGGFLEFQASYTDLCEDKSRLMRSALSSAASACLTSLSQPCLPTTNVGPTRILPFLYLGSQQDANNRQLLADYNITYEVNVSTNCPQPDFIQDSHFLRLPVNDSYGEKLLPYFVRATQFIGTTTILIRFSINLERNWLINWLFCRQSSGDEWISSCPLPGGHFAFTNSGNSLRNAPSANDI